MREQPGPTVELSCARTTEGRLSRRKRGLCLKRDRDVLRTVKLETREVLLMEAVDPDATATLQPSGCSLGIQAVFSYSCSGSHGAAGDHACVES